MSSNPNTKLAIQIFGENRTVGYMIVNSLKLPVNWKGKTTIVLNIPQKCQNNKEMEAKNTQKS
jgi:hypothetical protein